MITVNWYGPYSLDEFDQYEISLRKGIYAIYRVYGGKEKLIYIGKTTRSFYQRMREHKRDWLWNIRGQLQVRVGLLEFVEKQRYSDRKLADVEALLIVTHAPPENTTNAQYYYGREKLRVVSKGKRGEIRRLVSTEVHLEGV
ncbi:GIY-YIG nuclease family protein [Brevibacillus reuszeri]|nr:GIY-YIG nuclease family protein [Brevibacillus reuszeri]KNB70127.1 hypothetical protein ADS79_26900 [Brevibacillus reuszeri]MED1861627.1 GIY-YIG nuclease family protein [Brevibacillus reuszeri]